MSHDDPSTKDATKKPPDRGGSSFLRSGSSPSLARMGARWAAFSLAAAVLLCGTRALADDGVFVHIDSPVPAQIAEYSHHVGGRPARGYSETSPVCDSPCDRRLYLNGSRRYAITGAFPMSPTFRSSDLTGNVTITVQPGSHGRFRSGIAALCAGAFTAGNPGVLLYLLGRGGSPGPGSDALSGVGIGFMVAGGVAAITGALLLAAGTTKIKLQESGAGPVGRAAPVKPRYWMGEF